MAQTIIRNSTDYWEQDKMAVENFPQKIVEALADAILANNINENSVSIYSTHDINYDCIRLYVRGYTNNNNKDIACLQLTIDNNELLKNKY